MSKTRESDGGATRSAWGVYAQGLFAVYRTLGLLVLAAFGMTCVALWIHHRADVLPSSYTVFEPLRTLKGVLELPGFMVAVLVTFWVGRLRLRGEWKLDAIRAAFTQRVALPDALPGLGRRAGLTALVLVADALVLDGQDVLDFLALGVLAFVASKERRGLTEWL
ncbi:MAG TPA: hypothetical protein VFQ35_12205, partial [Polyangiaceae bacterium]|nr:hypothetical protein [Polyangiaceae bacterium]